MDLSKRQAEIIIESLKWSIYRIRRAHETKYISFDCDYEEKSIKPIQEIIDILKQTL